MSNVDDKKKLMPLAMSSLQDLVRNMDQVCLGLTLGCPVQMILYNVDAPGNYQFVSYPPMGPPCKMVIFLVLESTWPTGFGWVWTGVSAVQCR